MNLEIEIIMPFVLPLTLLGAYWLGNRVRDSAHVIIPFKDPYSWTVFALMLLPVWIDIVCPDIALFHCDDIWYLSGLFAAFLGYVVGYVLNPINMTYVAVHDIVERTQEIYPIVYYYGPDGRMYLQSQKMKEILKTMVFGVRCPLYFPVNQIARTRKVHLKKIFMQLEAQTVDLAKHEITYAEQKVGPFRFKVEIHKYTPTPNCMDSPYDFIIRATEYEKIFDKYADLEISLIESKAELRTADIRGGAKVIASLAKKTPSNIFMDELEMDIAGGTSCKKELRKEMNGDVQKGTGPIEAKA